MYLNQVFLEEEDTADGEEQVTNIMYFTFELKFELTIVLTFSYVTYIVDMVDNKYRLFTSSSGCPTPNYWKREEEERQRGEGGEEEAHIGVLWG